MQAVVSNPLILSGAPIFAGTRVPVRILFEYLESGDRLDEFLDEFPSVSRQLAVTAMEQARIALQDACAA